MDLYLWLLEVWHSISNIMNYLTSRTEEWEADSMPTLCQPWEVRDFQCLDKEMSLHWPGKSDLFSWKCICKKNQNKKVRFWETNKVAADSTSKSSSLSFIRFHCKSPTSQENMKFTSSHKDSAHLPSAAPVFLWHRTMNIHPMLEIILLQ